MAVAHLLSRQMTLIKTGQCFLLIECRTTIRALGCNFSLIWHEHPILCSSLLICFASKYPFHETMPHE
uniref:Uncharacterized protein MANES_08G069800 n=1 Tax=Rhizophora mucronata TaxID=61149 RepID=A0A2P2N617_RHIMU